MPLLAVTGLPPLRGAQFFSSDLNAIPVVLILIAVAAYLWGARNVRRLHPRHPWPAWRTVAWIAGLVVTAIAIFSFIGVYDRELFWDHMVEHLALIMVAAPLLAMASPLDLAFRGTSGAGHDLVKRALRSKVAVFLGHPIVAFAIYAVTIPITHLTILFNYVIEYQSLNAAEHVLFLVVGYLFWRHIFGSDPNRFRLHPALQFGLLFLAVPIDTFTGLTLSNTTKEIFPAFLAEHRTWGPSPVEDLHLGGFIMWVGGDTLMLWPLQPLARRWLHQDERSALRIDRELAALQSPLSDGAVADPRGEVTIPPWVRPIDLSGTQRPSE